EFLMGMHGHGLISSPHVVAAFDLGRFRRLVDLGGATGHLAIAACRRWLDLRAVVFDLPEVVPLAREITDASPVGDRLEGAAGRCQRCGGRRDAALAGRRAGGKAVGYSGAALCYSCIRRERRPSFPLSPGLCGGRGPGWGGSGCRALSNPPHPNPLPRKAGG